MAGGGGDEEEDEEPRGTNKAGHSGRTGWTGRWGAGEATGVQVRSRAQASGERTRARVGSQPEDSEIRENGAWRGLGTRNRTVGEWASGWMDGDGRTGDGIGSEVWDFGVERQKWLKGPSAWIRYS